MMAVPLDQAAAFAFIGEVHRHHPAPVGWKYGIGAMHDDELVGVVSVGRPVSRHMDDGRTLEINRLATDGTKNACSFLYGRACKAAFAMGYERVITYTLAEEPGTSLRASRFVEVRKTQGGSWDAPSRPRTDKAPTTPKLLWVRQAEGGGR